MKSLIIIIFVALPALAFGIVDPIGFNPEATLSSSGTEVAASGVLRACKTKEKTTEIQVTILQESTLASARGTAKLRCDGTEDVSFEIEALVPDGKPAFAEGPAQACGLAIRRAGVTIVDIQFWCAYIDLVEE